MQEVRIEVTDANRLEGISNAAIWYYPPEAPSIPTLVGRTNSVGQAIVEVTSPRIRVSARGYAPIDYGLANTSIRFRMRPNHPASYSGFLPGADSAIWMPKDNVGPVLQFTAFGLARQSETIGTLGDKHFSQYRMLSRLEWRFGGNSDDAATDAAATLDSDDAVYEQDDASTWPLPAPPSMYQWAELGWRDHVYPALSPFSTTLPKHQWCRFPEPGKMITRSATTNEETIFEFIN